MMASILPECWTDCKRSKGKKDEKQERFGIYILRNSKKNIQNNDFFSGKSDILNVDKDGTIVHIMVYFRLLLCREMQGKAFWIFLSRRDPFGKQEKRAAGIQATSPFQKEKTGAQSGRYYGRYFWYAAVDWRVYDCDAVRYFYAVCGIAEACFAGGRE
ncbi:MAG: hypothetical protein E7443_05615 [Ruminococcaceae bacterium]|nr:hypothetical protein [Oscillospiraceae bacterium]